MTRIREIDDSKKIPPPETLVMKISRELLGGVNGVPGIAEILEDATLEEARGTKDTSSNPQEKTH